MAGLAVLALAGWLIAGFVIGILHVIEIVLLGGAAGWAGYQIGRFRGRHERRDER
jgi:hypothetical protein